MRLFRAIGRLIKRNYDDPRDVFVFAALGLIGYGLWEMYRFASLVVVGGILLYIALFHYRPTAKKGE